MQKKPGAANEPFKLIIAALVSLPIFYLFWVIFVGTFALHELLIGIIGTLLAVAGLLVVGVQYPAWFAPTPAELASAWRLPWYLISGSWEVLLVAAKDLLGIKPAESLFQLVSFRAGANDDAHDNARRVLAVTYTTVAPNFIVLGINVPESELVFHQIEKSSVPKMTKALGAQE